MTFEAIWSPAVTDLKVKANSDEKTYNGKEQSVTGFTATITIDGEDYKIANGGKVTVDDVEYTVEAITSGGTGINARENPYPFTIDKDSVVLKANGVAVEVKDVQTVDGNLKINKRSVTVTGKGWDAAQPYTGKVYTKDGQYSFGKNDIVEGQNATITYTLNGTEIGEYTGTFEGFKVMAGGEDVTANYELKENPGHLKIEGTALAKDYITLKPTDIEKEYDGTPAKAGIANASDTNNHSVKVEYSVDGKQWTTDPSTITATNVKDSKTIKVRASVPGVYAGYAETTQKLTITERLVTVTGDGWDAYQPYTGKEYQTTNYKFENVAPNQTATISYELKGTKVGTYTGTFESDFKVMAGENEVTANYKLTKKTPGTLNIVKDNIVSHVKLTPANVEKNMMEQPILQARQQQLMTMATL